MQHKVSICHKVRAGANKVALKYWLEFNFLTKPFILQ